MTDTRASLRTCPECGGILQMTEPEPLTSAEVAAGRPAPLPPRSCQCLICGYEEPARDPVAADAR